MNNWSAPLQRAHRDNQNGYIICYIWSSEEKEIKIHKLKKECWRHCWRHHPWTVPCRPIERRHMASWHGGHWAGPVGHVVALEWRGVIQAAGLRGGRGWAAQTGRSRWPGAHFSSRKCYRHCCLPVLVRFRAQMAGSSPVFCTGRWGTKLPTIQGRLWAGGARRLVGGNLDFTVPSSWSSPYSSYPYKRTPRPSPRDTSTHQSFILSYTHSK